MVHHVHDYGYKRLFSNVTIFRQLLETFVPEPWVKDLDFSTAETVDHSFIAADYKATESDLIYRIQLKGQQVLIYTLLEFQSSVDKFISVRILNYITSLYLAMIKSGQITGNLPPVYPILLYNGDPRWTAPEQIADTIDHHELLGEFGIGFKYLKIIENEYAAEDLLNIQNIVSTLFLAENHYQLEALGEELMHLFEKEDRIAVSLFLNWFKMLAVDGRIDATDYRAFEKIYTSKTEVKQMFVNAISEKDKRLIAEGEAKGEAKGERNALRRTAQQMKADGMPLDVIRKYTGLSLQELQKL
jgi:predicted transposase/invertase (TIGR01784 family)